MVEEEIKLTLEERKKEARRIADDITLRDRPNDMIITLEDDTRAIISKEKIRNITSKVFNDKIYQAEMFTESNPFFYDKNKLWWLWDKIDFKYKKIDEVDILNLINEQAGTEIIKSNERGEILNALKQTGRKKIPKDAKESWVQFKNKIYDIETDEIKEATADFFITNPINWELGSEEETLALDILFKSWVGEERYKELYELLAFCLVPSYFIHRIFCLIGSGANGKSTFLNVLSKFIGEDNITSSSLFLLMTQRFEGSKLLKKLSCLMGETNFNLMNNTDFIKKLTGQDLVRAEFKGVNCFDFRNYAKLIIGTNSLPPTADKTDGFYRRWKILEFNNKFLVEKDVLCLVPEQEYNNLALKCLNIAKNLWKNRKFTNDGSFEERRKRYEEKSNPMMTFIKENYERNINKETLFSDFYNDLDEFLESRGFRTLSAIAVSKQLKVEGFEIKKISMSNQRGNYIVGLKEKNKEETFQVPIVPIVPHVPHICVQPLCEMLMTERGTLSTLGTMDTKQTEQIEQEQNDSLIEQQEQNDSLIEQQEQNLSDEQQEKQEFFKYMEFDAK